MLLFFFVFLQVFGYQLIDLNDRLGSYILVSQLNLSEARDFLNRCVSFSLRFILLRSTTPREFIWEFQVPSNYKFCNFTLKTNQK